MFKTSSEATSSLVDEPSMASLDALAGKLQADFVSGFVSSKSFDHRARVARQQKALLSQRSGHGAQAH